MAKFGDSIHIESLVKKASAALLAAVTCFYMSIGALPLKYVLADEVSEATAEEDGGDEEKQPETKPETKAPDEKAEQTEKPEETESEEKTPEETEDETETPSDTSADVPEENPEAKPEDKPEDKPDETPEQTPSGTTSETPEASSDTPSEAPSANEPEPAQEEPQEPAQGTEEAKEEIKYVLSGKGYLPKNKAKKANFKDGVLTIGKKGKRLEAFSIKLKNETGYSGSISYRAYVRKKGWTKWVSSGKKVGTKRKNLRIEAVQIKLTGELANHYFVEYKASISSYSDRQGWVHNAAIAGTRSNSKRIEVLQVRLVPVEKSSTSSVVYRLRGQTYGWQNTWSKDGQVSGTFSKRLEGLTISLGPSKYLGGIAYRTYVESEGWKNWASNGSISAGKKKNKRIEALQIKLTGEMANHYDVYYRVYLQSFGWLDWAVNGQTAGGAGVYRRIEKIQIVLREKDTGEPGDLEGIISAKPHAYYGAANTNAIMTYKNILDCGYTDPDEFRKKLIKNFEYMDGVGYFHMGKMVQGYTDCAGSVSLAFRVALGTAKFTKKYKKGTLSNGKQLYGIGINYCGIKSYKDKYGWCRNGTASVNSHFLKTIVKNRKIKYSQVSLEDRNDGVQGWSNEEWIDFLNETGAKPGDVIVWFNHDWSKTKGQHMTMYAGIGEDGIAYEWTASSTYGVILSPLTNRSPQKIFEAFTLIKGVADLVGYN
ncbi:MAG: hypothetical protein IKW88_08865 [Clostridiales bacterium]|nr:hypothetical protein [Clostridiales bacterium]